MTLEEYLRTTTQEAFAETLEVSQGLVHQWLNWLAGRKKHATKITAERAVQIEAATDGKVTKAELRPDIFGLPLSRKAA